MNTPMSAYIVFRHLVSQRQMYFSEFTELLGWSSWQYGNAMSIIEHIYQKLQELQDEWGEDIPDINAFVLIGTGKFSSWVCEYVFEVEDEEGQPSAQQVAELRASVETYDNWDRVVEAFREDAFSE